MHEQLVRKENRRSTSCGSYGATKSQHYRYQRHTKKQLEFDGCFQPMKKTSKNGLNHKPLFRWLVSKIGQDWDTVFSEACKRIPYSERKAIFYCVEDRVVVENGVLVSYKSRGTQKPGRVLSSTFRYGEAGYYQQLYVDQKGVLRAVPNS